VKDINDKRWQEWCDAFLSCRKSEMTQQQATAFLKLTMLEHLDKEGKAGKHIEADLADIREWRIFKDRCDSLGVRATFQLLAFLLFFSKNVGTVVMWAHALRRLQQRLNKPELLTITDLSMGPFAMGFPDEAELHRLWNLQKITKEEEGTLGASILGLPSTNYLDFVIE
jgi:hypothetical protein